MKTIDYNTLIDKMNHDHSQFILLNALEPSFIRKVQIPNSLNIIKNEDFEKRLNKDDEIVVYSSDTVCNQSINLYFQLEYLGYKNVSRYAGGLREWYNNGQALEEVLTSSAASLSKKH